jgi:hypothetical protein
MPRLDRCRLSGGTAGYRTFAPDRPKRSQAITAIGFEQLLVHGIRVVVSGFLACSRLIGACSGRDRAPDI